MILRVTKRLGRILADQRRSKGFTQREVGDFIGLSREAISHIETGDRKEPLSPEQTHRLAKLLDLPVLTVVKEMGYQVEMPGFENDREVALVQAFRSFEPARQQMLLSAAGIPLPPPQYRLSPPALRRIAEGPPPE